MKVKSSKLRQLESNRKSILTDNLETCFICRRTATDIHEIFGGANRQTSMKHNLCVPLCRKCHQVVTLSYEWNLKLKKFCQKEFERKHTREEWMQIIGRNYL